jgi:hypothetical protein
MEEALSNSRYVIFSQSEKESGVHGMDFENQGYWSEKLKTWASLQYAYIYSSVDVKSNVIALPRSLGWDAEFKEI